VLQWAVHLAAAAVGMYYSYDFGSTIGGPVFGVVLALNGALFCSIVAGALIEQVARLRSATGPGRHRHSPG
jgi:putative effector of murein hydrolase LrgA (UPF0299 family)